MTIKEQQVTTGNEMVRERSKHVASARRGFTLVELLVVIAIIAILAAVVMIAINPLEVMRKGRDATRLQDMENVRKAIDMTIAQGGSFSGAVGPLNSVDHGRVCGATGGWVRNLDVCGNLSTLPVDPTNSSTFQYQFRVDSSGNYEIRCKMESSSNFDRARNDGGSDNTCTDSVSGGGAGCWYEAGTDPGLDLMD